MHPDSARTKDMLPSLRLTKMIPYCSQNNLRCDIYRIRANALRVPGMNLRLIINLLPYVEEEAP